MADVTEKLKDLASLFREGLITREQFDQERDALLSHRSLPPSGRPTSIGSYRITGSIGQGGMGRVYRGRHRSESFASRQNGDVAIKVLHAQYTERADILTRFEQEAELGIKLVHPGIVKVHELVVDGGRVALVMELIEGRPLSQMIGQETGPIPWVRAQPLFEALLDAVDYAHRQGVIHRDLKPENVMVSPNGQPKVLDFGIAKDLSSGRTKTGTGMGTVDYMAPEQYLDAKSVDARADIYALGMTLYEMLAGRLPWSSDTLEFNILESKKLGDVPPPTTHYPDIPPRVVEVMMQMLEPQADCRLASVQEVRHALAEGVSGRPQARRTTGTGPFGPHHKPYPTLPPAMADEAKRSAKQQRDAQTIARLQARKEIAERMLAIATPMNSLNWVLLLHFFSMFIPPVLVVVAILQPLYIFRMAKANGSSIAFLWALLTWMPCLSLIPILIVNSTTMSSLRRERIRVGFMGVPSTEMNRLRAQAKAATERLQQLSAL